MLASFFTVVTIVLERGFRESAEEALKEKLQIQIFSLLSVAELDESGLLKMPFTLREPRLNSPGSGLYAFIHSNQNELLWRSNSGLGEVIPDSSKLTPGEIKFSKRRSLSRFELYHDVIWETESGAVRELIFSMAEDEDAIARQISSFRSTLWTWLSLIGVFFIVVQIFVLRWNLKPLKEIVQDLNVIEGGKKALLEGPYPKELDILARNLNALIHSERKHIERYRNSLADLAHSLKTPLAIIRGHPLNADNDFVETLNAQVTRMDEIVGYQLQKAGAKGKNEFVNSVNLSSIIIKIIASLQKVYKEKNIEIKLHSEEEYLLFCEEGDLYEIIGNLLDNACKWCHNRIDIKLQPDIRYKGEEYSISILIEDDGPGIKVNKINKILKRGARIDQKKEGQGIGMAVVCDLVELLGGRLLGQKSELGGVLWQIYLP